MTPKFIVDSVVAGSPAETAGLRAGDVITSASSQPIRRELDFERVLLTKKPGDEKKAGGEEKKAGGDEKKAGGDEKKAGGDEKKAGGDEKKAGSDKK